jgi:hypothetical protein
MKPQFQKHYSRETARALLPKVRLWLVQVRALRNLVEQSERKLAPIMAGGNDAGGATVNEYLRALANLRELLAEFGRRDIILKDLDRGLVDFPAFIGGREVFLCWEDGEDDIEFWHDLDAGYAGRERI